MIRNIANVALYESKTLYRSWFFRIFSILALFILFGLNSGFFGNHMGARWTTRAIAANIPYINVLFINVAQAIIAVFLASDFLRRDKKLDTTEVIYARPITNGEYVVGKTAGILVLFVGLVVLALGMALVFNLVRQDVPVVWEAYLWYPLLISIPTMVFILGLSFFLMILFRSQAVTFLVLLGYIGLTLFYFQDKAYGLLDYMAFNLPMVYSDFIGFSSPRLILLHRIAYLMMGLGFIFATIRFLNRLPQTGRWNLLNLGGFVVFLAGGLGLGFLFFQEHVQARTDREESIELNNRYADMPPVDVVSTDLRVVQMGEDLDVRAVLEFRNPERNMLDTLVFSLNPGFRIDSLTLDGAEPSWERRAQLILVAQEMSPGARGRLDLHYRGKADPSLAFLDVPREQRDALKRIQVAPLNKDPGFGRSGYQLLTPELFWYPMAGVGFNLYTFLPRSPDYVTFRLDVEPGPGLIPVAPGRADSTARGWSFRPEQDLNAFPLLMGPFEKKSLDVDGIPVELYIKPDHDFFSSFFTHSADTLAALVRSAWDDYEIDELDLYYPFPRVRLVEVPIQYHAYERPTSQVVDYVFPELILLPEKGAGLNTLDFARDLRFEERRDRERETARTEREIEVDQFKRFLQNTFFQTSSTTGRGGFGFGGEEERDELITFQGGSSYSGNPFSAFPLYYNYMTTIPSREYPMLNAMVELYLKNGFEVSPRQGFEGGITDKERANLALKEKPMLAWFADYNTDLTASLIEQTGSYVISSLKNRVGSADFDNFLYYYVEDHAFMDVRFEEFARDFRRDFGLDIRPYLESMGSGGGLASFLVSEPEYIQTRDDLGDVYLVKFHISNTGDARGLLDATFRIMGSGGFGGGSGPTTETRLFELDPGQNRAVQVVLYDRPMMMTVNTLVSGNIPSSYNYFLRSAREEEKVPMDEYIRPVPEPVSLSYAGEVVVDNEDPGFRVVSVSRESKLKQYIDSKKDEEAAIRYESLNRHWTPGVWTPVAHSAYYGESIRSALAVRSGDGTNTATWSAALPRTGYYDVYVWVPVSAMVERPSGPPNREGGGNPGSGQGMRRMGPQFADQGATYQYTVSSNEGSEEVALVLNNPDEGWNRLGTFHFPADSAHVVLSNRTNGKRVLADAVKWVWRPD